MENELKLIIQLSKELSSVVFNHIKEQGDEFDNLDSEIKYLFYEKGADILKTIICAKG